MSYNYDKDSNFRRLPLPPLPTVCPECYAALLPSKKLISRKTWVITGLGLLMSASCIYFANFLGPQLGLIPPVSEFSESSNNRVLILVAPLVLTLWYFLSATRVFPMKCRYCSWEKNYIAKNREKFVVTPSRNNFSQPSSESEEENPEYIIDDGAGDGWNNEYRGYPSLCPECDQELIEPKALWPRRARVGLMVPFIGDLITYGSCRVLPFECYNCGWKKDYKITESHKYDLPTNHGRR